MHLYISSSRMKYIVPVVMVTVTILCWELIVRSYSQYQGINPQRERVKLISEKLLSHKFSGESFGVFLGPSNVFYGLQIDVIEEKFKNELGAIHLYNFGIRGTSPRTVLRFFKEVEVYPEMIFIDLFSYDIEPYSKSLLHDFVNFTNPKFILDRKREASEYAKRIAYNLINALARNYKLETNGVEERLTGVEYYLGIFGLSKQYFVVERELLNKSLTVKTKLIFPYGEEKYLEMESENTNNYIFSLVESIKDYADIRRQRYIDTFEELERIKSMYHTKILCFRTPMHIEIRKMENAILESVEEELYQACSKVIDISEDSEWHEIEKLMPYILSTHLYSDYAEKASLMIVEKALQGF